MSSQLAPDRFRRACSLWATGITVLTTVDTAEMPHGMTANSFTSVSLDPPLILFCLDKRATLLSHLGVYRPVAINVLAEDQAYLSSRFASKSEDRFENLDFRMGSNSCPLLTGALATFECTVQQTVPAGDHEIIIALVHSVEWREGRPLVYFASSYEALQ